MMSASEADIPPIKFREATSYNPEHGFSPSQRWHLCILKVAFKTQKCHLLHTEQLSVKTERLSHLNVTD